ncbi:MAG: MaoC/PaaZ C-terminal domain-containing protein [Variibacter sp.]
MPLDYDRLMSLDLPPVEQTYSVRDTMLYALGLGFGVDPIDEAELAFVYEKNLKVLPTMACVLGHAGARMRERLPELDWVKVVHGEQSVRLHRPLPAAAAVIGESKIVDVIDKGAGKGAILVTERVLIDKTSGEKIATLTHSTFARGDGGFGGPRRESAAPQPLPARPPDLVCDIATRPEIALIYRLSGDYNPLHAEPAFAAAAGFPRPILHGLATFGIAGRAILRSFCGYDPTKLTALQGRFSAPVFPGETVRTEMWQEGSVVSYRCRVEGRDIVAISNGRAEIAM